MSSWEGLVVAVCQLRVVPGRPDLNAAAIVAEIEAAARRGADVAVFPELAVPGYFVGDLLEDESFVRDVLAANEQVREATRAGITAIWGSLAVRPGEVGEDGRARKLNAGLLASRGVYLDNGALGVAAKALLPRYRIFDDARHFTSARQLAEEARERQRLGEPGEAAQLHDLLQPFEVPFARDPQRVVRTGVFLCEDMWDADYPFEPGRSLVENGAELLVNLSASPWTWQKNRKRHQVVGELLGTCGVPLVYVNNTGLQDDGKNLIVFDGASTVYDAAGQQVARVPAYAQSTLDVRLAAGAPVLDEEPQDDSAELFAAVTCALREFLAGLPPQRRRAVVGVSGGIDSAVVLAWLVHVLGPAAVLAVTLPSKFTGPTTLAAARELAGNLGVELREVPIQAQVDAVAAAAGVAEGTPAHENLQARQRMQMLASIAGERGALFTCNGNKVELAFGYATLHGDLAGALAPLGDLVKREVRQMAEHLNRVVYGRPVIPQVSIEMRPSAELGLAQCVEEARGDPFDYGTATRRGYHDELVRAITEFRRGPEWLLERYAAGRLEADLLLPPGTLLRLFPDAAAFVADLEECWRRFVGSVFKRVQAPPLPIVSRRAFGQDLREALLTPHLTRRYQDLRRLVLARQQRVRRVAIYGGSFSPPGRHHRLIVERLARSFATVVVVPCYLREDKPSTHLVTPEQRRRLVELAFDGPAAELDLSDLDGRCYTPTWQLQERMAARFPGAEIWHVVGADLVAGGSRGESEIQRTWTKGAAIWHDLRYAVLTRSGYGMSIEDLPPRSMLVDVSDLIGSSSLIRQRLARGEPIGGLLDPAVEAEVREQRLYRA